MNARRGALVVISAFALAWASLVACGSDRPPPAEITGSAVDEASADVGARTPEGGDASTCIDVPMSIPVEASRGECVCRHRNSNGDIATMPCGWSICIGGVRSWFCTADADLLFYEDKDVASSCDAAGVPPGTPPCPQVE